MRRWLTRLLMVSLLVPVAAVAVAAVLVGPYYLDDQRLDGAVMAVALDWRDFGQGKARERLQYELDHRGIGFQIGDDACVFDEQGQTRIVRCAWDVDVAVPFTERRLPLAFESRAEIAPDGDLR